MKQIMVDLETTGVDPGRHAILQIAAWRFDLMEGEIDLEPFNRSLMVPAYRSWSESTRAWWYEDGTKRQHLFDLQKTAEDPRAVMTDFVKWCKPETNPIFWSKPSHFDFMFVSSYLQDFGLMSPFHYRNTQDMNSFLRGMYFPEDPPVIPVEFMGDAHNAVWDALNQIQVVWAHLKDKSIVPLTHSFQQELIEAEVVK